MEFSRKNYWNWLPFLTSGGFPDPGMELGSPASQVDSLPSEHQGRIIMNNHFLLGIGPSVCYIWHSQWEALWFLTKFGDRRDWKWKRTPAFAIWSSHLLLASHVSISFSLLLSNIWFKAAMSCSEKAQTVATRLWQKTMSLRSCVSLSVMQENIKMVL